MEPLDCAFMNRFSFFKRIVWLMVSKALARSRNTTAVTTSLSILKYHWFVASSKAVTVECRERKPEWYLVNRLSVTSAPAVVP